MPPITLNNRYKYNPDTDLLGKGGLGAVYKAYDNEHSSYVAIKKFDVTGSLKYSLRDEFQKSIAFSHDNLVRSYHFFSTIFTDPNGETHETQYGVMELIEGGDLGSYLQRRPPLPELLEVVKGILYGLRYLHTYNPKTDKGVIIHRDIKPANILIYRNSARQPIPKITDFNIAKEASTDISTQTVVGTYEYMSPEQFSPKIYGTNGKLQPNTDLWSLGVLLCDHLLQKSVFGKRSLGQTQGEITHNVLNKALPTTEIQKLPAPFNHIIAACLVRHATQRIQSADALLRLINQTEDTVTGDTTPEKVYVPPHLVVDTKPEKVYVPHLVVDTKPGKVYVPPHSTVDTPPPRQPEGMDKWVIIVTIAIAFIITLAYLYNALPPKPEPITIADTTTIAPPAEDLPTIALPADTTNHDTPYTPPPTDEDAYTTLLNQGNELFVQEKYAAAKAKYAAALQQKPNDPIATANSKKCDDMLKPKPISTEGQDDAPQQAKTVPTPAPTDRQVEAIKTTIGGGGKPSIKMISIPGRNFKLSETEVTIGQYLAFCKATNSHYPEWLEQGSKYNIYTGTDDRYKYMSESSTNYPITGVSALDADAFCRWMGGRLPTEQEWQYAAKGGQNYEYAGSNNIGEVAWYSENGSAKCHPVKQKQANGYGLYDMTGNVYEWTSSTEGMYRVLRGGSWVDDAQDCRGAIRANIPPVNRRDYFGFRLVLVP